MRHGMHGKKGWAVFCVKAFVFMLILAAVFGLAVMLLWNWLMPEIFGLTTITFWQAVGLLALSWILFRRGMPGRGGRGGPWRRQRIEAWRKMTPEQREEMRGRIANRCGWGPPEDSSDPSADEAK